MEMYWIISSYFASITARHCSQPCTIRWNNSTQYKIHWNYLNWERLYRVLWLEGKRTNKFPSNYLIKTYNRKSHKIQKESFKQKSARIYWEYLRWGKVFPVAGMKIESLRKLNREKYMKSLKAFSRTFFTKIISSFLCEVECNSSGEWDDFGEYIIYERIETEMISRISSSASGFSMAWIRQGLKKILVD
jgi:hypothetical protein